MSPRWKVTLRVKVRTLHRNRIHYLQWTGIKKLDRIVGFTGIVLVIALTTLGAWLAFKRS